MKLPYNLVALSTSDNFSCKRRGMMNTWDNLISEGQRLNEVASKVQSDFSPGSHDLPDEDIEKFVTDYLSWYTDCLTLLPEDLKSAFRGPYETRIRDFLINPTKTYEAMDEYEHYLPAYSYSYQGYFYTPFFTQRQILLEANKRQQNVSSTVTTFNAVEIIEQIGRRFDLVARQLTKRYNKRETLTIVDEYDVQNLFHAMLKLFFDDIRREEWTPSYAGKSSRIDFLLKNEEIIIEIKKTRSTLKDKELSDELIIDKERYQAHPKCKTLIAFVYDPDEYIDNPKGLETDLNELTDTMVVKVIISPG